MAKAASKSTKKASAKPEKLVIPQPLYGGPIREAVASGDLKSMKSMATKARKHLADVNSALAKLDQAIAKTKG
ncbi:MAG: DUF1843 domain-containing protein [Blastocatellia bacterium]